MRVTTLDRNFRPRIQAQKNRGLFRRGLLQAHLHSVYIMSNIFYFVNAAVSENFLGSIEIQAFQRFFFLQPRKKISRIKKSLSKASQKNESV